MDSFQLLLKRQANNAYIAPSAENKRSNDPLLRQKPRVEIDTAPKGDMAPTKDMQAPSPEDVIRQRKFNEPDIRIIFFDPRKEKLIEQIKQSAGLDEGFDPSEIQQTRLTDLGLLRIQLKSISPWFDNGVITLQNGQIVGTDDRAGVIADLLSSVNAKLRAISDAQLRKVMQDSQRILTVNEEIMEGYRKKIQVIRQPRYDER
ncbi:hypothetical protein KDK77_06565 [bacterium]|nr:hypothetical protein [bacterium]